MRSATFYASAFIAALVHAIPTPSPQEQPQPDSQQACDVSASQFYLVTTTSPLCNSNSSNLPFASATSLFTPFRQPNKFVRTIEPGYLSLPIFSFANGALHTFSTNSFGQGNYSYSTPALVDGKELQFLQGDQGNAGLTLTGGFMLGIGEVMDQWKLCPGDLGQTVIRWKDASPDCNATYIQAVAAPPY